MDVMLSIIIVTYNPNAILTDCLNSLKTELALLDSEIIVVDNASQAAVTELFPPDLPSIRLIANTENKGFANANNQGIAAAAGKYILLLNPDVVVRPGALPAMVTFLESQPAVGIIGPRTLNHDDSVALTAYPAYTPWMILWQYLGLDRLFPYHVFGHYRKLAENTTQPFMVAWVQASCMLFPRALVEQIGGLDENLFLYSEEPDFCERAAAAGWQVMYFPGAQIYHLEAATTSRYPLVKMRHFHRSPLYYFRKRGKGKAVIALKIGFSLELVVKFLIRLAQLSWLRSPTARARLQAYPVVIGEIWRF